MYEPEVKQKFIEPGIAGGVYFLFTSSHTLS